MESLTFLTVALGLWLMLALMMALAWWIEQRTGNSGWVDVVWTCAMGLTGITGAIAVFSVSEASDRQLLVAFLVLVWSLRLAGHIARRTSAITDDPRYKNLREQWGATASQKMFWLLQTQAVLSLPMVISIILAAWNPAPLFTTTDVMALIVFGVGLIGSAIADQQLTRFKQNTTSSIEVCDEGLWAWSRHPNYFFEFLVWVAFALMAINAPNALGWGYLAFIGPICMYLLLRYVSGVPPLEKHMLAKYGDRYVDYQKKTSAFFPLPPTYTSH